jgi:hypothetical protein
MLAALLLTAAVPPLAVPGVAVQPDAAIMLPASTPVRLATQAAIDSRSVRQGQRFALRVTEPVKVGDRIIIPLGTVAVGEVEAVDARSSGGRAGKLALVPLFIEWRGERIFLRGRREQVGVSNVGASVAVTVLFSPLGGLISGRSASLPAGSVIDGEIRSDVKIAPAQ